MSPTLFSLFINDLAIKLKELHCGIKIANDNVSILLYADDIVLLSDSEDKLQIMLKHLNCWCIQWSLSINILKSSIVHFRPKSTPKSQFNFVCGTQQLCTVKKYTYLGVTLDEHLSFLSCIESLLLSGNRALSSLINRYNVYRNFTYDIYVQLYDCSVIPTMLYGAEIWGFIETNHVLKIQNRALRFFMGVHNKTPIPAMMGDMGWTDIYIKQSVCMIRFWNRMISMDYSRLTKRIFLWDYNLENKIWNASVLKILSSVNCKHMYLIIC